MSCIAKIFSAISDILTAVSNVFTAISNVLPAVSSDSFPTNGLRFTGENDECKGQCDEGFLNDVFHDFVSFLIRLTFKIVPSLIVTMKMQFFWTNVSDS